MLLSALNVAIWFVFIVKHIFWLKGNLWRVDFIPLQKTVVPSMCLFAFWSSDLYVFYPLFPNLIYKCSYRFGWIRSGSVHSAFGIFFLCLQTREFFKWVREMGVKVEVSSLLVGSIPLPFPVTSWTDTTATFLQEICIPSLFWFLGRLEVLSFTTAMPNIHIAVRRLFSHTAVSW